MVLYPIYLAYERWFLGALQTFREPPTCLYINCIRHSEKNNAGLKNISIFCQFFFLQVYFNRNCTPSIVNIKVPIDDLLFICLKFRYSKKLRKKKWGTLPPICEHLVHSFIFVVFFNFSLLTYIFNNTIIKMLCQFFFDIFYSTSFIHLGMILLLQGISLSSALQLFAVASCHFYVWNNEKLYYVSSVF